MMEADLAVLGSGSAGLAAAREAARLGARVVLLEHDMLGGECPNTACVPTKVLLRCAAAAAEVRDAGRFGIRTSEPRIDWDAIRARVRRITHAGEGDEPTVARWRKEGLQLVRLRGRLEAPDLVKTSDGSIRARRILLATGSYDSRVPVPGIRLPRVLTHKEAIDLPELPERLGIIGAGPVGVEFAQIFAALGVKVLLVSDLELPLPREEEAIGRRLKEFLASDGIDFRGGIRLREIEDCSSGCILCFQDRDNQACRERVDLVLTATGHAPSVADLGLDEMGVEYSPRGIRVDETLRTNLEPIYAAGDVTGVAAFTHVAAYQGRLAARHALGAPAERANYRVTPRVTFCRPEAAAVGRTARECAENGLEFRAAQLPLSAIEKQIVEDAPDGVACLLAAADGTILGAHVLAPHAGELIHQPAVAMQVGATVHQMGAMIHAFPTFSEIWEAVAARLK